MAERHRVEDVRFERGVPSDAAPLLCDCGWSGCVADWPEHRRTVQAAKPNTLFATSALPAWFDPAAPGMALPGRADR